MPSAPFPDDENKRLDRLRSYDILDSVSEQEYDDIVLLAAKICKTPIALISLVDRDRQWFKAKIGLDVCETHRDFAFCSHAILNQNDVLEVTDATLDDRFKDNFLVNQAPYIRFYAGAPLITPDGIPLGTLCVIDTQPRTLSGNQKLALRALSRQVSALLELRHEKKRSDQYLKELRRSNADLAEFAHAATHDLKEPLRGIQISTVLLNQDLEGQIDEPSLERLRAIGDSSQRLQDLIERLLYYCQVGRTLEKQEDIDLNEVLEDAIGRLSTQVNVDDVIIEREVVPPADVDPILFVEVFQNLISNAVKYNDQTVKKIHVGHGPAVDPDTGTPVQAYHVIDNGIGIAESNRDAIFTIFRRLHSAADYGGGCGTGLTIVRKVIQLHGGKVWVNTTEDGRTRFCFTI